MAEDRSEDTQRDENVSGIVSHIEILCEDVEKSARFYEAVFGWEISNYELEGRPYTGWRNPEGGVPGGFRERGENERPGVINYIKTFNMDDDLEKISRRGGRIIHGKRHIPEVGWIARYKDPFGNIMGLFEPNES
jgi:hypothetical protein